MKFRLPTFMRTTTFRLALLYSVLFSAFSAALLIYLYSSTVAYIRNESTRLLDDEFRQLENAYFNGGMERLADSVFDRMGLPGSIYFYHLEDSYGTKMAGNFVGFRPPQPTEGSAIVYFDFEQPGPDDTVVVRSVAGRVVRIKDNGALLMVAFEPRRQTAILGRIQRVIFIAAPIGLALSLLGGFLISRGAARRADELARTAEAVMGGELGRRAPVRGSGDEFDRLGLRMNAMLDQIEKLVESSRHTGNAIAHDLRSPLSRLRNRLEVALAEPLSKEEANATLGETVEEVDRVLNTFNAILRLARLEAGAEGQRARLDVSELALELAEFFTPACEEAELTFKSQVTRGLTVLGDRDLIGQAMANLLDNAVKYTAAGGAIQLIVTRGPENTVDLTVIDSGPGIPEHARALVVLRFHRLDSARTQSGSGLGLTLVDSVADMHGGKLILTDAGGPPETPGLKATLRLPRT
jgi:signal transduction histidine kinase